ncbi:MAG: ZIP family metal transporter [Candidatus Heimdallarchaeota archaeon]|nr:ZIP family metal transporter [Candidatus Heimdallarchaeota archaeon]MCK4878534.1 ZIP family metal transporter [Candidatus Heimdallarchaeota archaeon]
MDWWIVLIGTLASLAAGISTGIGALPVFFMKDISEKVLDLLLGFAAGVMLAASAFSLLIPALNLPTNEGGGVWIVCAGVIAGVVFIALIDKWAPHKHFVKGPEGKVSKRLAATWLFVIAITIHNFPEGLAVGVSFGLGEDTIATGVVVAMAIGLQNIPEGTAVAMPLLKEGYTKKKAFLIAAATGLVEPIGAFVGVTAVSIAKFFLGFGMAFAAGAMIFVVADEIIPETHREGKIHTRLSTYGIIAGFVIMMFLDNFLEPFLANFL